MPSCPGCLYLIVEPLGDVMVVTPSGSAGACRGRGKSVGDAEVKSEARAASARMLVIENMLAGDVQNGGRRETGIGDMGRACVPAFIGLWDAPAF